MTRAIALLTVLALLTGCSSTYRIPREELYTLNGYREDQRGMFDQIRGSISDEEKEWRLTDEDGNDYEFDEDFALTLNLNANGRRSRTTNRYQAIDIDKDTFTGTTTSGRQLNVDLLQVDYASTKRFSLTKTLLLTGGITLGVVVVLSIVAVSLGGDSDGSSSSSWDWD